MITQCVSTISAPRLELSLRGCATRSLEEPQHLQTCIHLHKSSLGLFKEAENDALRKLAFVLVVVHLEDLFERQRVDVVAKIGQASRAGI